MAYSKIITGCHGEIYYDNSTGVNFTLTNAGTYYAIGNAGFTADKLKLFTADLANGTLTASVGAAGRFMCIYSISYQCTNNNVTFVGAIYKGGNKQSNISSIRKVTQGSTVLASTSEGILDIADGDVIDFRISCDNAGEVVTVKHFNLSLERISG